MNIKVPKDSLANDKRHKWLSEVGQSCYRQDIDDAFIPEWREFPNIAGAYWAVNREKLSKIPVVMVVLESDCGLVVQSLDGELVPLESLNVTHWLGPFNLYMPPIWLAGDKVEWIDSDTNSKNRGTIVDCIPVGHTPRSSWRQYKDNPSSIETTQIRFSGLDNPSVTEQFIISVSIEETSKGKQFFLVPSQAIICLAV